MYILLDGDTLSYVWKTIGAIWKKILDKISHYVAATIYIYLAAAT